MIDKKKTTKLQIYLPLATAKRVERHAKVMGFPFTSQWVRRAIRLQLELEESKYQQTIAFSAEDNQPV